MACGRAVADMRKGVLILRGTNTAKALMALGTPPPATLTSGRKQIKDFKKRIKIISFPGAFFPPWNAFAATSRRPVATEFLLHGER
jgi:hypothetical protein